MKKETTEELLRLGIDVNFISNFQLYDKCHIPKKVKRELTREVSVKDLKTIDSNKTVAIEKCLLILSQLAPTIVDTENYINGWKKLSSTTLNEMTKNEGDNTFYYKRIINLLVKYEFIEVNNSYHIGVTSKQYRLTSKYRTESGSGISTYQIKTKSIIKSRQNTYNQHLASAITNVIARNSIMVQPSVQLPTEKEILERGRELVKQGYVTNKGKKLTMRNKHNNSYWNDINERSFVEDDIKMFQLLTELGYMIPSVGDDKSGGRVVDSFVLMPSWIRKMIKINDNPIVENDYSALHPNLCANLYNGPTEMISHDVVANYLGVPRSIAKREHLSFFNKRVEGMRKSPLYKYYDDLHPQMLNNIITEKKETEFGHKITSMKLFKFEVDIMTDVIAQLNLQGIYVIYVYDALYCNENVAGYVSEVMDKIAAKFEVKTNTGNSAKIEEKCANTDVNAKMEEKCVDTDVNAKMEEKCVDTDNTDVEDEYSDVKFRLGNGQFVNIKNTHLEYWASIQHKRGLLNSLKKNNFGQLTFDMAIDDRINI